MTKVFLSYATEDNGVARTLATLMGQHGLEVFWYEERNLGDFVEALADGLAQADRFVVLLSRHYQQSNWCKAEWKTAYRLSVGSKTNRPVITVCEVGDFDEPVEVFLGNYARLNLRPPFGTKLPSLLKLFGVKPDRVNTTKFRDRERELTALLNGLETINLWVVTGPPRMGKSWFLEEVEKRLTAAGWGETRLVDLARHPDSWHVPSEVVVELLGVDYEPDDDSLTDEDVWEIAREISERQNNQIYLLDSVERLTRTTAEEVRQALTAVHSHLVELRMSTQFCLIIGTRRPDVWRGLGRYARSRFTMLQLPEFTLEVVEEAVREIAPDADDALVRQAAVLLHGESDGLPALLAVQLGLVQTRLLGLQPDLPEPDAFEAVTARYVRKNLLTHQVLFPSVIRNRAAANLVNRVFHTLSPYRLITQSHLKFHYDQDQTLRRDVESVGWTMRDLWTALNSGSLLDTRMGLWRVVNPPIRRLLYRYYHRTDEERIAAHEEAKRCYERWAVNEAGSEQVVMMKECLWHELCLLRLRQPSSLRKTLPEAAVRYVKTFLSAGLYDPREFGEVARELLTDDFEFQRELQDHDGLFTDVLEAIETALSEEL